MGFECSLQLLVSVCMLCGKEWDLQVVDQVSEGFSRSPTSDLGPRSIKHIAPIYILSGASYALERPTLSSSNLAGNALLARDARCTVACSCAGGIVVQEEVSSPPKTLFFFVITL